MSKLKIILAAAAVLGLSLGLAGSASAAAIACGDCHGATTKTQAWESHGLPLDADKCDNTGRGLHGVHGNYSSASYAMSSYGTRGTCSYCHTSSGGGIPTATHNNNYVNITGNQSVSGRQIYDTRGLDYNSATSTCTNSCHKNNGATAKWGNYTSVSTGISLNCSSCHDDSGAPADLSGAHAIHLGTIIPTGTALDGAGNAKCAACHPDNTNDLWSGGKADDGTKRAYPHASDGTKVISANATVNAGWGGASCTAACHTNSTADAWSATELACNSCHNDTGTTLGGAHNAHIAAGKTCANCHTVPGAGDTSHATALPLVADNATVALAAGSFNDGAKTCSNTAVGCHGNPSITPNWYVPSGTTGCTTCHNYPDGQNWVANNGHAVQYDTAVVTNTHLPLATTFNKLSDTYAGVTGSANSCGKCHGGGTHNNGTVNVAGSGNGNCGGNFTITKNAPNDVTCGNVKCHSGKTTPNWW